MLVAAKKDRLHWNKRSFSYYKPFYHTRSVCYADIMD